MNRIKDLRYRMGMTQTALAEKLRISRTAVSKYELEQLELGAATTIRLCEIFGCTADYLLGRSPLPSPDLTPDEENMLLAYRAATPEIRAIVDQALSRYKEEAAVPAV